MGTITSLNEEFRPIAPDGFEYAYTQEWSTNRAHTLPGSNTRYAIALLPNGQQLAAGYGPLRVECELPAKVFVYREIILVGQQTSRRSPT